LQLHLLVPTGQTSPASAAKQVRPPTCWHGLEWPQLHSGIGVGAGVLAGQWTELTGHTAAPYRSSVAKQLPDCAPTPAHGEPAAHGHEHMEVVEGQVLVAGSAAKQETPSSCWQGFPPVHAQIFVTAVVGAKVGANVGPCEGVAVGKLVGADVGSLVGVCVGSLVGPSVGSTVGCLVGAAVCVGAMVGDGVSCLVGIGDGGCRTPFSNSW
jgi:hypothetical protein